ncbi:MAG TPA: lysylphosphatidylglycerol synthase transmembrane domain-containing protein [Tepidisphaeraceae bacterium]|nr:lysylphosphatidylglycerol synthase transmembrane domain-containing protein [Tepidisphaeraceae bacterium]
MTQPDPTPAPSSPAPAGHRARAGWLPAPVRKWGKFVLRWTIAVVGIGWVVLNTPLYDKVTTLDGDNRPIKVTLAEDVGDRITSAKIIDPVTGAVRQVSRDQLVNPPDTKWVEVREPSGVQRRRLLALDLSDDLKAVRRLLVENPGGKGAWVTPERVEKYELGVPFPLVDQGIVPMVRQADRGYLWAAVLIFPVTFLITGLRWHLLLTAVDIGIGAAKSFVINMVGAFYNTFMPGSTGGDVLKAYYAAKLNPGHRTRAVMSVIVDRAIGLLGLIILGGAMAGYLATSPHVAGDAVAERCAQVAIGAGVIVLCTVGGLLVLFTPVLRRATGLDFILRRMPMQEQVGKAIHTLELYRQRPALVLGTLVMTFPVHITVIFSAMCAGMAFGLPLTPGYYWVVVPVVVLAGAVPISPQGAGVMEFFAILLTRKQGCTVSQAFALTMSIRLVQIFWNLWGGLFVMRGGYHAPTPKEQASVEHDDAADAAPPVSAGQPAPAQPAGLSPRVGDAPTGVAPSAP